RAAARRTSATTSTPAPPPSTTSEVSLGRWVGGRRGALAPLAFGMLLAGMQLAHAEAPPEAAPAPKEPEVASTAPAAGQPRFFLHGDGVLQIENAHTREKIIVRFRNPDGTYSSKALDDVDRLFRSRGDDERTRVSLRLLEVIDYLEDTVQPKSLLLISGYRSEGYNDSLIAKGGQAARSSMHSEGLAADLRFV